MAQEMPFGGISAPFVEAAETVQNSLMQRQRGADMARVTYFVVIPFVKNDDGDLLGQDPIECRSAHQALSKALQLAKDHAGAIAFSRSGDPNIGEFDDAVELGRFGEVPADLE